MENPMIRNCACRPYTNSSATQLRNLGKTRGWLIVAGLLLQLPAAFAVYAQTPPTKTQTVAAPFEIQLQSRKFTPAAGVPANLGARIKRAIAQAQPTAQRVHVMIQLQTPPETADREGLGKDGITLLEPLNRRTWYASVTPSGADALAKAKNLRWAELVQPQDKLTRAIQGNAPPLPYQLRPGDRIAYSVLFHKDVNAEEVQAFARRADVQLENFDPNAFRVVRAVTVNVPRGKLAALSEADIIAWIEPAPPPDKDNNLLNAQPLSRVDRVQAAPFNLDGTGVAIGTWEAGDTVFAGHLDLTPRVIVQAGQSASNDDHASHVAGTIGASGVNVPNARGMAPNVTIASWDAVNDAVEMTNAATSLGNPGQPTPIQISNHSYGPTIGWNGGAFLGNQNLFGAYTNQSVAFDNVVFQTGLIVVKSAGNDRDDAPPAPVPGQPADCFQGGLGVAADCIGPTGVAKNVITVGAMNGAGAIASFSSFGPTDDGRIKPDVVAHGVGLRSLASNSFFSDANGDGVDDVPNSTTANTTMSGTSMATPVVTGVTALVLQDANARNIAMSPAAMKALLIQTARDVQGIGQATVGPDFATGWGIVDAEAAINLLRQSGLVQATLNGTGAANAWSRNFFVPAGLAEIHLTLAWDDPAGVPGGQILINDLDLRLTAPDATVFTPWRLNPANPTLAAVRDGGNDSVNNVEQVSVLNPMAGVWTVQVSSNAGNLPQAPQPFAVAGLLPHSDVVLVMDRSGSMSLPSGTPGVNKLQALRTAANQFIDLLDLGGGHRVGLVQFAENLVPLAPVFGLQALAPANLPNAHAAINGMTSGGLTNIIAGVNEAAAQLGAAAPPFPRQTIVVFSDGRHNRPFGSSLTAIGPTVQAGGFKFYSIGFGTDIDDATLSDVAAASGGIHVNEQDLSPIQLTKHFLTIGALTHDMAVLADPAYQVGAGETAKLAVNLSKLDQSVTFAVNWTGEQAGDVKLTLLPPDKRCQVPLKDHGGLQVRKGDHYRLIRVKLPYFCNGLSMHDGAWTLQAQPTDMIGDRKKETVDITVLGDSRVRLTARSDFMKEKRQLVISASLLRDGKPASMNERLEAIIVPPLPNTGDGERQDGTRAGTPVEQPTPAKDRRLKPLQLKDDGKGGDAKASDGIYTATLDVSSFSPGLFQARVIAKSQDGKLVREVTTSFYVRR